MDWKKELQAFSKTSLQKVDTHVRHATTYVIDKDPDADIHFVTTIDKKKKGSSSSFPPTEQPREHAFIGSFEASTNICNLMLNGVQRILNVSSLKHSTEILEMYKQHNIKDKWIALDDIPDAPNLESVVNKAIEWLEDEQEETNGGRDKIDDDGEDRGVAPVSLMITTTKDDDQANKKNSRTGRSDQRLLNVVATEHDDRRNTSMTESKKEATTDTSDHHSGVLIHCNAGISRSATIICAWLMLRHNHLYNSALELVRKNRPSARPNDGFDSYLKHLDAHKSMT